MIVNLPTYLSNLLLTIARIVLNILGETDMYADNRIYT